MLPMDYAEPDAKIIEVYKWRRPFLVCWKQGEAIVPTDASQCRVAVAGPCNRDASEFAGEEVYGGEVRLESRRARAEIRAVDLGVGVIYGSGAAAAARARYRGPGTLAGERIWDSIASRHALGTAAKYPATHTACAVGNGGHESLCQTRVCQPGREHQGPRRLLDPEARRRARG